MSNKETASTPMEVLEWCLDNDIFAKDKNVINYWIKPVMKNYKIIDALINNTSVSPTVIRSYIGASNIIPANMFGKLDPEQYVKVIKLLDEKIKGKGLTLKKKKYAMILLKLRSNPPVEEYFNVWCEETIYEIDTIYDEFVAKAADFKLALYESLMMESAPPPILTFRDEDDVTLYVEEGMKWYHKSLLLDLTIEQKISQYRVVAQEAFAERVMEEFDDDELF